MIRRALRVATFGAVTIWGCVAYGQSAGAIADRAEALLGQLSQIQAAHASSGWTIGNDIEGRLADGHSRYVLGEHQAAVDILLGVVEDPDFRNHVAREDATFMLAESLYETRNYILAQQYYEGLVANANGSIAVDSAQRLLEIAFEIGRYDGLEEAYAQLSRRGDVLGPAVAYVRGKAQYFQGEYGPAMSSFSSIGSGDAIFARARYFMGVIRTRQEDYPQAVAEFEQVLAALDSVELDDGTTDLRDLTYLALGRCYYETNELDLAVGSYAQIPRSSPRFDEALYEISWSLIREERYVEALQNLERLELFSEEARIISESVLLQGDLEMRIESYEEALELFERVANEYNGMDAAMSRLLAGHNSPSDYFDALINPQTGTLRLPEGAAAWFSADRELTRVLRTVQDLYVLEEQVSELRRTLERLETAVRSSGRVDVFPTLREAWAQTLEVENTWFGLSADLADIRQSATSSQMDSTMRTNATAMQSSRRALQREFESTPQTLTQMDAAETEVSNLMESMVLDVYREEQQIRLVQTQIEAMRDLLVDEVTSGVRTQQDADAVIAGLDALESEMEGRMRDAQRLREDLSRSELAVGVGGSDSNSDALRQSYREALAAEHDLLGRVGSSSDVTRAEAQLAVVAREVAETFAQLEGLLNDETREVEQVLAEERLRLETYEQQLVGYYSGTEDVAGAIAYASVVDVQARLTELNLRANLGVIDVGWRRKEAVSTEISELFAERNRQVRVLDADFAELLLEE